MNFKRISYLVVLSTFIFTLTVLAATNNITVTSPQAGQVVQSGDHVTITWNYTGDIGNTLFLNLVHRSGDQAGHGLFNVVIDFKAPAGSDGHGTYDWVVPDVPTGYTYTVSISSNYAGVGADCPSFTVVNQKQVPTIKVTSPNGGEVWHKGQTYAITWTHVADPNQKTIITLIPSNDPATFVKLGETTAGANGAGTFTWEIPANISLGKDYHIWLGNGAYHKKFIDRSDNVFTIAELFKVGPIINTNKPKVSIPVKRNRLDPQPEPPM